MVMASCQLLLAFMAGVAALDLNQCYVDSIHHRIMPVQVLVLCNDLLSLHIVLKVLTLCFLLLLLHHLLVLLSFLSCFWFGHAQHSRRSRQACEPCAGLTVEGCAQLCRERGLPLAGVEAGHAVCSLLGH